LQLAHPFAPFVTETIWQTLKWEGDTLLVNNRWPEPPAGDTKAAAGFDAIIDLVSEIRFISAATNVSRPTLQHQNDPFIAEHAELISSLAKLGAVEVAQTSTGLPLTGSKQPAWLDLDAETIKTVAKQLAEKVADTQKSITQLEGRLANKAYVDKAPTELVEQTKQQLTDAKELLKKQQEEYARFS
jgi:valyl-tRNA synthetase